MDCSVCCEKMAKEIACSCGFVCCRTCIRTYLAEQIQEPHCMSCKKVWPLDYLEEAIGKTYTATTFKKIRAEVYLDYEKNQLAHTQSLVAKFRRDEQDQTEMAELTRLNKEMNHGTTGCVHCMGGRYKSHWCECCKTQNMHNFKVANAAAIYPMMCYVCKKGELSQVTGVSCKRCKAEHCRKCFTVHEGECQVITCICPEYSCDSCKSVRNRARIQELRQRIHKTEVVKEKREFIMNCQSTGCKGFLSTKYKCGLCEKYTCSACLLVKEEGHECNADDISTVRMIREETKPCPKCSTRISKIDGCDQMWCVECKTAFSWKSGLVVNGAIHNPHYYEFLRQSQGFVPRADNPCEELPGLAAMRMLLRTVRGEYFRTNLYSFHRFIEEVNWRCRMVNRYEEQLVQNRILYLMDRMDKKTFTQKAFMYYQRSLRFQRISELMNMLRQVLLDQMSMMLDILKRPTPAWPVPNTGWTEMQVIFVQVRNVCQYFLEQKKRSPFTSIHEEHIRICIQYKEEICSADEFDMNKWIGTEDQLMFMIR